MKRGFVIPNATTIELMELIEQLKSRGVPLEHITVHQPFEDFIREVQPGDSITVQSFTDISGSLNHLFTLIIDLHKRDITIESIQEPYLNTSDVSIEMMISLCDLCTQLRTIRTKRGMSKVQEVIRLRKKSSISIAKACEIVGCQPRTYYRHMVKNR